MSKLQKLILDENRHRRLAQEHDRRAELHWNKAEYHWNKANELLLEIMAEAENEKELDSLELANSQ